jgi:hypothetical protein
VARGAPHLHIVELDDTGNFTPEQAARLERFVADDFSPEADARHGDDRGSGKAIQWLARVVFVLVAGALVALGYGAAWFWSAVT